MTTPSAKERDQIEQAPGATLIVKSQRGEHAFAPPDNNDWVLVLDDEAAKFPAPGALR